MKVHCTSNHTTYHQRTINALDVGIALRDPITDTVPAFKKYVMIALKSVYHSCTVIYSRCISATQLSERYSFRISANNNKTIKQ